MGTWLTPVYARHSVFFITCHVYKLSARISRKTYVSRSLHVDLHYWYLGSGKSHASVNSYSHPASILRLYTIHIRYTRCTYVCIYIYIYTQCVYIYMCVCVRYICKYRVPHLFSDDGRFIPRFLANPHPATKQCSVTC